MSKKASRSPSLRTLKTRCSEIKLKSDDQFLLVSAPDPESTMASALLCRAIMKSGGTFHVSFEQPIMNIESIHNIRNQYESSIIVLVGIETVGKKKLRKGKGYPVFVGGSSESAQVSSFTVGNPHTVSAAAYVLAREHFATGDYELQMAAAAALVYDKSHKSPKKSSTANKALVKQALDKNLLEKQAGIRLFGFNFLPIDEVLLFSTRPYIQGISGDQKACDAFLSEADVPITKIRNPLTTLSNSEIQKFSQHLTSILLEKMGPDKLSFAFGPDYILTRENESSPLRYLSGLESIANTAWARQELGATMGIWIGDRGRALRNVIDTQMSQSKDVISAVHRLETKMKGTSSEASTSIELAGIRNELLTDIGRVTLQSEIVSPERPLVISNEECNIIIWTYENVDVNRVLLSIDRENLSPVTTSSQSIMLKTLTSESITEILKLVKNLSEGKR
jgi:RecJ-like exonuclease